MGLRTGGFLSVCAWSNLGVAVVYAGIGAWSVSVHSFPLAFIGAMAVSGLALLLARRWAGRASGQEAGAEREPTGF